MTKWITALLSALLLAASSVAGDYSSCFVPGETVSYKIYWMGIPIAWSTTTTDTIEEEGRELIRITLVARTYAAYKHIFEVDDKTEVIIDPETALPIRHDWIINEGTIHKSHLTTFDHAEKTAVFLDRISKDLRVIPIAEDTQEIFSFIYANRNADLEQLAQQKHRLLVTGKLYDLSVKIAGHDNIKVRDHGKVASVEIEPVAEFDGIFLRQGKVFFWISKEKRRVVTCIKSKVAVGRVTAKLQSVSGAGQGFWNNTK